MDKMRIWVDIIIMFLATTMIAIGIFFCVESSIDMNWVDEAIGGFKITTGIITLLNMFNKKMERK